MRKPRKVNDLVCCWCERHFTSRMRCPHGGPFCSIRCARLARLADEAAARLPRNAVLAITANGPALHPVDSRSFSALADAMVELDDALELLPRSMERDALVLHRDAMYAAWSAMTEPEPHLQQERPPLEGVA